jgi:hypothetical protein
VAEVGRSQFKAAYGTMSHQIVTVAAVIAHEIRNAVTISPNHSRYDTNASPYRHPAAHYSGEISARAMLTHA